jgi:trans-2,3-dihydro-3-hydroxyanthranilate isomerase
MAQQTVIPDSVDWLGGPDQHPYLVVDVFTSRALEGNQLGVFLDGRPFSSEQMQQLAREMSFAETVFLLPPRSEADVWVRIFTPSGELPFAGHPVLGTAFVVGTALGSGSVVLETGAGSVPVALDRADGQIVFGRMQQPIPEWEPFEQEAELLSALGVQQSTLPVELYRIGPTHVYVGLSSDEAVASLRIDLARLTDLGVAANCFAGHGRCWKTRMFCPAAGVPEDAATGSAAGPLAVHLARHGQIAFGEEIEIRQGEEINRPSLLYARASGTADRIESVEVGGAARIVASGRFRLSDA